MALGGHCSLRAPLTQPASLLPGSAAMRCTRWASAGAPLRAQGGPYIAYVRGGAACDDAAVVEVGEAVARSPDATCCTTACVARPPERAGGDVMG